MPDDYKIDFGALKYWILFLVVVASAAGLFMFTGSEVEEEPQESNLSMSVEDDPVSAGDVTTLFVKYGGEQVEGAEIQMEYPGDYVYIGETNSEGALSFEARDEDFYINSSYRGEVKSELVEVEGRDNPESTDGNESESTPNENTDDSEKDSENTDEPQESEETNESTESDDKNSESDSDDQADFTGFRLENDPVAEETNRLTLLKNGEGLGNQKVQLNGDELGTTTTAGGLTFEVPNVQEIRLKSSDIQDSFQVEGYEQSRTGTTGNIDPDIQKAGMEYVGETVTFDASGTESQNEIASYNWTFDHKNFNDTLQGETVEYTIPEEGSYEVILEVEDVNRYKETGTSIMNADPEYSGPEITLTKPADGDTVTAEEEFQFQVENARTGQEANIVVNGNIEASVPLESGINIREDAGVTAQIPQTGSQNYWITVEDSSNTWESNKREIENTRAYGDIGTFSIQNPSSNSEASSPVSFEFSLDLKTDVNLEISGQGTDGEQQFSNQTTVSSDQNSYTFNQELNATEYNWQASISVPDTSESESSGQRTLTVQ